MISGLEEMEVTDITDDSRSALLESGRCLFAAVPGEARDGHDFIGDAVARGARCVLAERPSGMAGGPGAGEEAGEKAGVDPGIAEIIVPSVRSAIGPASAAIYGRPSERLTLAGVTGTNGKTTVTYLLEAIFQAAGFPSGVVGTVNYRFGGKTLPAPNTTPGAPTLQRLLRDMAESGVTHCAMEVSSHGLHQRRVDGCAFDVAVFTNLTHDHMDYHETEEDYFSAKKRLFGLLKDCGASVINIDDPRGRDLALRAPRPLTTGLSNEADIHPRGFTIRPQGIDALVTTPTGPVSVSASITGRFNLENILSAIGAAFVLGMGREEIERGIAAFRGVPGRLERIEPEGARLPFTAYVDYAHTPDALRRLLETVREMMDTGRLILVFGCGGGRDRTKRPEMAEAAARGADIVILTSDNPRDEDPMDIIRDAEKGLGGMKKAHQGRALRELPEGEKVCLIVPDRAEAIRAAVGAARAGDVLILAGKGHEDYQIVRGVKMPFDDRLELMKAMGGAN